MCDWISVGYRKDVMLLTGEPWECWVCTPGLEEGDPPFQCGSNTCNNNCKKKSLRQEPNCLSLIVTFFIHTLIHLVYYSLITHTQHNITHWSLTRQLTNSSRRTCRECSAAHAQHRPVEVPPAAPSSRRKAASIAAAVLPSVWWHAHHIIQWQ